MIGYLSGYYPLTRPDSFLCKCRIRIRSSCSHFDLVLRQQRLFLPWSLIACLPGGGGPQKGEVTCVGLPYLTCKRDQIKMRDYMDRRVTSPKRVTLHTCGPLPLCKEAPNLSVHEILVVLFFSWPQGVLDLQDSFLEGDRKVSALFGHFIAAVGDLNRDGYQGNCGNIQTHRSEGDLGFF